MDEYRLLLRRPYVGEEAVVKVDVSSLQAANALFRKGKVSAVSIKRTGIGFACNSGEAASGASVIRIDCVCRSFMCSIQKCLCVPGSAQDSSAVWILQKLIYPIIERINIRLLGWSELSSGILRNLRSPS